MVNDTFDNILVWAYPASGKSETFEFVRGLTPEQREALHLGTFVGRDDYPLVASFFKVDDALESVGLPRVNTRQVTVNAEGLPLEGGFSQPLCWEMLDKFLVQEYDLVIASQDHVHDQHTILLECARGGALEDNPATLHHGYRKTLERLPDDLLERAVVLYVKTSPETSRRKNCERFDPANPLGTMGHMVPENVMHRDYGQDDVAYLIENAKFRGHDGYVQARENLWVPIGVLDNETTDLTSFVRNRTIVGEERVRAGEKLHAALEATLQPLYARYEQVRAERADRAGNR